MDEKERRAMEVLVSIHRMESYLRICENTVLKDYKITPMQIGVLDTLSEYGEMKIQDLIDRMSSTSGNMTVIIRNLERDGYIHRNPVPEDKRCCMIGLSDEGRNLLDRIMPEHRGNITQVLKRMPEKNQELLTQIIRDFLAE